MGEKKWRLVSKLGYVFEIIVPDKEQPKSEQHDLTDEAMGVGFIAIKWCQDFGGNKANPGWHPAYICCETEMQTEQRREIHDLLEGSTP